MSSDDNSDDDAPAEPKPTSAERTTGYKSPPRQHRFKKGVSGNPRGRPKGALGKRKIAEKVLLEQHDVVENGEPKTRTTLELILLALRQEALEGGTQAAKAMQAIEDKYGPQEPDKRGGVLVVPGRLTQEAWDKLFAPKEPVMSDR